MYSSRGRVVKPGHKSGIMNRKEGSDPERVSQIDRREKWIFFAKAVECRLPRPPIGIGLLERAYRGVSKGLYVLLSRTQAGPGRAVKQEQEENSRNHVRTF